MIVFLLAVLSGPRTPRRPARRGISSDAGAATAEYAVLLVVACGFALVFFGIVHSATVHDLLVGMVRRALSLPQ